MRRAATIGSLAVLVLIGFLALGLIAPRQQTDANASVRAGMSVFDLHLKHRGMNSLPVQEVPLP